MLSTLRCFVKRAQVFLLFFFSNLAEGTTEILLRRSRGLKAGKRARVMEDKTKIFFVLPMRFVGEDEEKKVREKKTIFCFLNLDS